MTNRRSEQATLFEVTACGEFKPPWGPALEPAPPNATPRSGWQVSEGNTSRAAREEFKAVSPLAGMPLHEACAVCGSEINGRGFVILDYEELGAFCDQDCADKRFRSYLQEAPEEDL
jgi:hypothetical protein